jgi:hypothetical protein
MEKKFTSDEIPIRQILDEAKSGDLQLPDFQRGWVWDDDHISSQSASITRALLKGKVLRLASRSAARYRGAGSSTRETRYFNTTGSVGTGRDSTDAPMTHQRHRCPQEGRTRPYDLGPPFGLGGLC